MIATEASKRKTGNNDKNQKAKIQIDGTEDL